ncbi:hypothetical protein E2C01_040591 [Portunus trituberculatus]|uniref:Uncharacterized protein n=1 Tax=Portunus trituberculatus TaxID=210409 RepID=A0A5B7FHU4_PORTR|nr:hypothetical protein [Portunus trituberculatus]
MGTRANTTSSFGTKMRIEQVGGNREEATVSSLRQLCFSEEKKMRFSRGEVVFHSLKIRSKTAKVAEVNVEKVEGGVKTFVVFIKRGVQPGDISGLLPRRGLRGWVWSGHFFILNFK